MDKKIGFIGCGNMGKAILGGLIASGQVQPGQIWVYTPSPDKVAALRDQYGINWEGLILDFQGSLYLEKDTPPPLLRGPSCTLSTVTKK